MTPVLLGRWQTRFFTMFWFGIPITFVVVLASRSLAPVIIWFFVLLLGFFWDVVYNLLQKVRWDRDWPGSFQFLAAVWEAIVVFVLLQTVGLPFVRAGSVPWFVFLVHYWSIWIVSFWWVQGPMRAFFPRWRFNGGRIF